MTIVQLWTFRDHPGSSFNEYPWMTPTLIFFFFLLCSCGVDIFSPVISCMWGSDAMQWKHNLWHRRGNYPAVWNSEDIKRWHLFANNPNIVQVLKHRKKIRTTMSITCPRFDLFWKALNSQQWVRTVTVTKVTSVLKHLHSMTINQNRYWLL